MSRTTAIIGALAGVLVIAVVLFSASHRTFTAGAGNMFPALEPGDSVTFRETSSADRGDIVAITRPELEHIEAFIFRVVAIGGDEIESIDGVVYVNGDRSDGVADVVIGATVGLETQVVPEGHYFVLGDNRGNSTDSRQFGPVASEHLIGARAFGGVDLGLYVQYLAVIASIAFVVQMVRDRRGVNSG